LQITDLLFLSKMRPSLRGEWHYLLKNFSVSLGQLNGLTRFRRVFNNTTLL